MFSYLKTVVLALLVATSTFAASKPYSGTVAKSFPDSADGSILHPYVITTAEELMLYAELSNDSTRTMNLTAELGDDIVFNEGDASTWATKAPKYKWVPINNGQKVKSIVFDGKGHSISGLYLKNEDDNQGFFGYVKGKISNLTIKNSYIDGNDNVGALVGSENGLVISNVLVDQTVVRGNNRVGGIVGLSQYFTISYSSFNGSVNGSLNVGGIVGAANVVGSQNDSCSFNHNSNYGDVAGRNSVGGLIGRFEYSSAKCKIKSYSYLDNRGSVEGDTSAGGIAGYFYVPERYTMGYVPSLFRNTGNVSGSYSVGGLFGTFSFSTSWSSGGLVLKNSYNAGDISGKSNVSGTFTPKTSFSTVQNVLQVVNFGKVTMGDSLIAKQISYSDPERYCDSLGTDYAPDSSSEKLNKGYPLFLGENPKYVYLKGSGTEEDPFIIETEKDFLAFGKHASADVYKDNFFYRQTADIEYTNSRPWKGIVLDRIVYDGDSHKISNLISDDTLGGVFARIDSSATISNWFLENVDITSRSGAAAVVGRGPKNFRMKNIKVSGSVRSTGEGNSLGNVAAGLVGQTTNYAVLENCTNLASVDAYGDYAGGIIAVNTKGIVLKNVVNRGDISGNNWVGGIVGNTNGKIIWAENHGTIVGKRYVGGIAGIGRDIKIAFNRGPVSAVDSVGGVAGRLATAAYVYSAAEVNADSATSVGLLVGANTYNEVFMHKNGLVFQKMFYETNLSDYDAFGKIVKFLDVSDTAGVPVKTLKSSAFVEKLAPFFKADKDDVNDGYPVLANPFEGKGTEDSPFLLQDKSDLMVLNMLLTDSVYISFYGDKHYKMNADVTFSSDDDWLPLGFVPKDTSIKNNYITPGFSGVFDGGGHIVSGLVIKSDTAGFFGYVNEGTVKNFGIENSSIQGGVVGGIVGKIKYGEIENCWNNNTAVYGREVAGGIVGGGYNTVLNRTYNTGTIRGKESVAGIVGSLMFQKRTVIANSFNRGVVEYTGPLDNTPKLAGIVAAEASDAFIENVYNVGEVRRYGIVVYTIVKTNYAGSVGKNTARLKEDDNDPYGLTAKEMRSKEFAKQMGEAFAYDEKNENDGYPILSGKNVKPTGIVPVPKLKNILERPNLTVTVDARNVYVSGLKSGEMVVLVNLNGKKIWSGRIAGGSHVISVEKPGAYVLMTKSRSVRILIK